MTLLIALVIGLVSGVFLFSISSRRKSNDTSALSLLQNEMHEFMRTIEKRLGESYKDMQDTVSRQFSESQHFLNEISNQMRQSLVDVAREQTKTNEATRQFITIADKLADLERTLKHQKQRGNWGELSLELILSNTLAPGQYKIQYEFNNGDKVDAVILTKEGMIPIDAKFSLDNYNRLTQAIDDRQRLELEKEFRNDLKKRIDETAKYIRTQENTLPFAFMYIPAEGIYYDLLINEIGTVKVNTRSLIDYAYNDKKVIIVSPTTFMAYLQSVVYGFKAFKIEQTAKTIIKRVDELGRHLKVYEDHIVKVGDSLEVTVDHYNKAFKEFGKVDRDITRMTGVSPGLEQPMEIDGPDENG